MKTAPDMGGLLEKEGHTMGNDWVEVHMLGNFEMVFQGRAISLDLGKSAKTAQLLLYFLYYPGEVSRARLLSAIYEEEEVSDAVNCLHGLIHRLRRMLSGCLCPEDKYISYRDGKYFWDSRVEVWLDVRQFEEAARRALAIGSGGGERLPLLREAVGLYRGELLPAFSTCAWVAEESVALKQEYIRCLTGLCRALAQEDLFSEALSACSKAVAIYPYDEELYLLRIQLLFESRRFTDAVESYNQMAHILRKDLGVLPSKQTEADFRKLCVETEKEVGSLEEIKREIAEPRGAVGAYYFDYPRFMDIYRIAARRMERAGKPSFLMMCMATDCQGRLLRGKQAEQVARALDNSIRTALRKSDAYTQYNQHQYLLLLASISPKNCLAVKERIERAFCAEWKEPGVQLALDFVPA